MDEHKAFSKELDREITSIGVDRLTHDMYRYFHFQGTRSIGYVHVNIRLRKYTEIFNADTRKPFKDWFRKICEAESEESFEEFETLSIRSRDFMLLSYAIYSTLPYFDSYECEKDTISVSSSDNVIFEMNKSAAIAQSVVLRDHLDSIPTADEIPLPGISSLVLPKVISFCRKKHKFNILLESAEEHLKIAAAHLKSIVDTHNAWVTRFVTNSQPLFSYLHQAADYLNIPSLSELTSKAVGDMRENSVEEISEWYAGLSISRMLSPLVIQAYSMVS